MRLTWQSVHDTERTDKKAYYLQHDFSDGTSAVIKEVSIGAWQWFLLDSQQPGNIPLLWSAEYFVTAFHCQDDFEAQFQKAAQADPEEALAWPVNIT